ncbi:MAG TPA: hypothetical protein VMF91_07020 [Bryobacteraceae bacterium]|nr:hypothetical protein [Bryobacteraceae bacterium]
MAEETPKEKYERLQREIQSEILTAYPNPTRTGCPGDAVVKRVAGRKELIKDAAWEHITHCSPCYGEFLSYKEDARANESGRKTFFRWQIVAAACLLVAAAVIPAVWNGRQQNHIFNAELDLRHELSFRGAPSDGGKATQLNPPLKLHRGHLHLRIDLPATWEPGRYDVAFFEQNGKDAVFTTTGDAALQGQSPVLDVNAKLDVKPGDYTILLRREGSAWRGYPVRVTDGPGGL